MVPLIVSLINNIKFTEVINIINNELRPRSTKSHLEHHSIAK